MRYVTQKGVQIFVQKFDIGGRGFNKPKLMNSNLSKKFKITLIVNLCKHFLRFPKKVLDQNEWLKVFGTFNERKRHKNRIKNTHKINGARDKK